MFLYKKTVCCIIKSIYAYRMDNNFRIRIIFCLFNELSNKVLLYLNQITVGYKSHKI